MYERTYNPTNIVYAQSLLLERSIERTLWKAYGAKKMVNESEDLWAIIRENIRMVRDGSRDYKAAQAINQSVQTAHNYMKLVMQMDKQYGRTVDGRIVMPSISTKQLEYKNGETVDIGNDNQDDTQDKPTTKRK